MDEYSTNNDQTVDYERALSPILSGQISRKHLKVKQKARVKLTNRFSEKSPKASSDTSSNILTSSQTENFLKSKREDWNSNQNESPNVQDFDSKNPKLPTEKLPKVSDETAKKLFGDILNPVSLKCENMQPNKQSFFNKLEASKFLKSKENIAGKRTHMGAGGFKASDEALRRSKTLFDDILNPGGFKCDNVQPNRSFFNKPLKLEENTGFVGFKTASGKSTIISENAVKQARNKFSEKLNSETLDEKIDLLCTQETNELFTNLTILENKLFKKTENQLNEEFKGFSRDLIEENLRQVTEFSSIVTEFEGGKKKLQNQHLGGFRTCSGKQNQLTEASLQAAKHRLGNDIPNLKFSKVAKAENDFRGFTDVGKDESRTSNFTKCGGFQTATETSSNLAKDKLKKAQQIFKGLDDSFSFSKSSKNTIFGDFNGGCKRKYSDVATAKTGVEKSSHIFNGEKPTFSPIRNNARIYNSTPLKNTTVTCIESDITPIKRIKCEATVTQNLQNDRFIIQECSEGDVNTWAQNLENERKKLEAKLKMIGEKQQVLNLQKEILEDEPKTQKRQPGVLFNRKQCNERVFLRQGLQIDSFRVSSAINSENSLSVHLKENLPFINTSDGACVVPNFDNLVGLSEIEVAFKTMPGVEMGLLPNGWIKNHFRWIVWKLASYENFNFDCLSVENIIQQLKYRYDREIDRAERPALRKIFETDDTPQKRMVLCVANIFNLGSNKFELELTDGWYSIRTSIDAPLCQQIVNKKIQIGTKLVISGAELVDCDGCHPLEASHVVRLKIHCNSTRRARWYAKLGYQKCPEPYLLKLASICPNGGPIGCIKVYIARVYPLKYLEKHNTHSVWRNQRAEDIRAQEWENYNRQILENVQETIQRDYKKNHNLKKAKNISVNYAEIRNIDCPETLFNICSNCNDPERLQEVLSESQKMSIMDYQQRILLLQQQEMSREIEDSFKKLQTVKRNITAVLTLLVMDALDPDKDKCYVLQIWNPSITYLQILKESSVCHIYNVMLKNNGNLSATSWTKFKPDSEKLTNFERYNRTVTPIPNITTKPQFNEFDTVGIVVQITVNNLHQILWLADTSTSLLFIKIFDSPKNCLLLDKLKVGQIVAIENLIFYEKTLDCAQAVANNLTVISSSPKHKHLQNGIDLINEQISQNLDNFLQECNQKVALYTDKNNITKNYKNTSKSLVTSSLLTSDIFDDGLDV
ncbi:uncharacterized protein LOC123014993 isoform X2 [Tribolium madens]|uniref:uncharacterized protein LOC123014993 isoform X2 n=1 Tax=Tribolium madens TaxID=41895 RepID=UPI001CF7446D|nr:uncharacterized protein LOC123014993 isoform X2 [Tribolium madens]